MINVGGPDARLNLFPHVPVQVSGGTVYDAAGRSGVFSQWSNGPGGAVGLLGAASNVYVQSSLTVGSGPSVLTSNSLGDAFASNLAFSNVALDVRGDLALSGSLLFTGGAAQKFGQDIAIAASNHTFTMGTFSSNVVGWAPFSLRPETDAVSALGGPALLLLAASNRPAPVPTTWLQADARGQGAGFLTRYASHLALPPDAALALDVDADRRQQQFGDGVTLTMALRVRDWAAVGDGPAVLFNAFFTSSLPLSLPPPLLRDPVLQAALLRDPYTGAYGTQFSVLGEFVNDAWFSERLLPDGSPSWVIFSLSVSPAAGTVTCCKNGAIVYSSASEFLGGGESFSNVSNLELSGVTVNGLVVDSEDPFSTMSFQYDVPLLSSAIDVAVVQVAGGAWTPSELTALHSAILNPAVTRRLTVPSVCEMSNDVIIRGTAALASNVSVTGPLLVGAVPEDLRHASYLAPLTVLVNSNVPTSTVSIHTDGDITSYSDRNLKTDLRVIDKALDRLSRISGYTFVRLSSSSSSTIEKPETSAAVRRTAGLIAQEVQQVLPEVVYEEPVTGRLSITYGNVVALLVEAVKDLATQNANLEQRLTEIESLHRAQT